MVAQTVVPIDTPLRRRRILLVVPPAVHEALQRCADTELRDARRQATELLSSELVRRGFLDKTWNDRR